MIALWLALGVVAGFALGWVIVPVLGRRPLASRPKFRAEAGTSTAKRLDEVIEAARAAALRVRMLSDGFEVLSQPPAFRDHVISVRAMHPTRVTVDSLVITDTGAYDLVFTVALALVPVFGPITVTEGGGEMFRVDGTKDIHELRNEKSARVTAKLRDLVSRLR